MGHRPLQGVNMLVTSMRRGWQAHWSSSVLKEQTAANPLSSAPCLINTPSSARGCIWRGNKETHLQRLTAEDQQTPSNRLSLHLPPCSYHVWSHLDVEIVTFSSDTCHELILRPHRAKTSLCLNHQTWVQVDQPGDKWGEHLTSEKWWCWVNRWLFGAGELFPLL